MGTNFYLQEETCPHCGRGDPGFHIGKSSSGWAFALHIIPNAGINGLDDWRVRWNKPGAVITDEYGDILEPFEMEDRILNRSHPRGLSRHTIDGKHCTGHGDGTYDLLMGDFS